MCGKLFENLFIDFVVLTLPYNQPRFCLNTIWNSNAATFANESFVGQFPSGIFVNSNNSIYIPNTETGEIHIWQNENHLNPTKSISNNLLLTGSIFVTTNGDIYVDNGYNGRIDKWIRENETWISVMNVSSVCSGLFIDIYENLYCSMGDNNRVDKNWSTIAGTGVVGSQSDMLNNPYGIFVDINLDLYVADYWNHRIQLFRLGQINGITVAGSGSANVTITLSYPSDVILDENKYLFITDTNNNRIIGSDENGFRCIVACSMSSGSTSDKLSYPQSLAFDSFGNLFVVDRDNHRIQKFRLLSNLSNSKRKTTTILSYMSNLKIEFN